MKEIHFQIDEIRRLCNSNRVKSLYAFVSITTDKFHSDSHIDLIVDINESNPITYSDYYFNLKLQLEKL